MTLYSPEMADTMAATQHFADAGETMAVRQPYELAQSADGLVDNRPAYAKRPGQDAYTYSPVGITEAADRITLLAKRFDGLGDSSVGNTEPSSASKELRVLCDSGHYEFVRRIDSAGNVSYALQMTDEAVAKSLTDTMQEAVAQQREMKLRPQPLERSLGKYRHCDPTDLYRRDRRGWVADPDETTILDRVVVMSRAQDSEELPDAQKRGDVRRGLGLAALKIKGIFKPQGRRRLQTT
ncbi:MAG TPA: hypothetical protein VLG92_05050 [Candidatus Saccharimonadia bacterium]|nr:hypothetical protein [Candidatus Saccharimonadia bacterium]